jgi:hypothetical protein
MKDPNPGSLRSDLESERRSPGTPLLATFVGERETHGYVLILVCSPISASHRPRCIRLSGIAVARQDLRGRADRAAENFIEGGAADLPAMRPVLAFHLPLADPFEIGIIPCEPPD